MGDARVKHSVMAVDKVSDQMIIAVTLLHQNIACGY